MCLDVSPHLIFKNGPHPTLWPQDVPFPGEENDTKNGIAGDGYHDDDSQGGQDGGIHYPSYFKDGKGWFTRTTTNFFKLKTKKNKEKEIKITTKINFVFFFFN